MQNPIKHPIWKKLRLAAVRLWQRLRKPLARFYAVLRHAATVISIAFASFKVWQFVSWWLSQSA